MCCFFIGAKGIILEREVNRHGKHRLWLFHFNHIIIYTCHDVAPGNV